MNKKGKIDILVVLLAGGIFFTGVGFRIKFLGWFFWLGIFLLIMWLLVWLVGGVFKPVY